MKSGSSSAAAFGSVLQAVRKHLSKGQADVAASFSPKLSVAAVSMAESGKRPPTSEVMVITYASALGLDEDVLLELWSGMQGVIGYGEEAGSQQWWRDLPASPQVKKDHSLAEVEAQKIRTPNEDFYAPSLQLFALSDAICGILRRLLDDTWKIDYKPEMGLRDPIQGRFATVMIELRARDPEQSGLMESSELKATFACPEPVTLSSRLVTRPSPFIRMRPKTETISPDVAWILSAVEAMPARERAAVAGFIHGLREGANIFSEGSITFHQPAH